MTLRDLIDEDPLLPLIIVVCFCGVVALFSLGVVGWLALANFIDWGCIVRDGACVPWPGR